MVGPLCRHLRSVAAHQAELTYSLGEPWPWSGLVRMSWILEPTELRTQIQISSEEAAFPVVVGWHPWFRRTLEVGTSARYELEATAQYLRDQDEIVTGEISQIGAGPFDDSFAVPTGRAHIEWPKFRRIDIESDFQFMHLYEANTTVCIEPETSPPNGVNLLDLGFGHIVRPQEPLTAEVHWRVSRV